MHPMLNVAIKAARAASRMILRYLDQMDKVDISEKSQNDFVTQVDQASETMIIEEIQKAYPYHTFLGEETGQLTALKNEFCWIIDPLDGTTNFIHGFPQFCISIALMVKGQLEIGLVYDPIRQDLFTATRGQGAYLNNHRMRVSTTKKMCDSLIATGLPFKDKKNIKPFLQQMENVFMNCRDIRRAGSAALDLAYVASGKLDAYWEANLKIWDIAAGALMVKEAGGAITDFAGADGYLSSGNIVAGNMKVQKELLAVL